EYTVLPLADRVKKPSPEIAKSSSRPVGVTSPCSNCWATLARRTPAPTEVCEPPLLAANTSANSARDCLKPVVAELAMLLETTERSLLAAFMPLRAMLKLMVGGSWWNAVGWGGQPMR